MDEKVLDLAAGGGAFVSKQSDPVMANAATPGDFAAQYPQPIDTTEIVAMCDEISVWQALPEKFTGLKAETWRELNELAFTSGSSYISFADGACPEEYAHDGDNMTVTLKNIGAKKSLTLSDIMHSAAVASAGWNGINRLIGPGGSSEGMPGGASSSTFLNESIADLKEKEIRLASTLVINGWDTLLVKGDVDTSALEFSGIENWAGDRSCTFHTNAADTTSGSFSAASFDRFLSEACVKPTHVFGHSQAIQEMLSAYFQLGFAGSQVINYSSGNRITPGFNFAGFVNTSIGRLTVVADNNFTVTTTGTGAYTSKLYTLRMVHNGEPLVYKLTQIPLALRDLAPGCTAIAFELWAKTALVIKHCCAQGAYTGYFQGRTTTTCPVIG